MLKKLTPVLLILTLFFSISAQEKPADKTDLYKPLHAQARQNSDPEEYAVYLILLGRWSDNKNIERIVIDEFTTGNLITGNRLSKASFPNMDKPLPIEQDGVDDFNEKNFEQKWQLSTKLFNGRNKIELLSESDKTSLLASENHWKAFYQKYPKSQGATTFSRVGFNKGKTKAIVYFGIGTNWRGGKGYLVTLEKRSGVWEIFDEQMIWQA
jgi:hypothetical protein